MDGYSSSEVNIDNFFLIFNLILVWAKSDLGAAIFLISQIPLPKSDFTCTL